MCIKSHATRHPEGLADPGIFFWEWEEGWSVGAKKKKK